MYNIHCYHGSDRIKWDHALALKDTNLLGGVDSSSLIDLSRFLVMLTNTIYEFDLHFCMNV